VRSGTRVGFYGSLRGSASGFAIFCRVRSGFGYSNGQVLVRCLWVILVMQGIPVINHSRLTKNAQRMESRVESPLYILELFSGHKTNSSQAHCQLIPSQQETSCVFHFSIGCCSECLGCGQHSRLGSRSGV
jgi:hypothetical protein